MRRLDNKQKIKCINEEGVIREFTPFVIEMKGHKRNGFRIYNENEKRNKTRPEKNIDPMELLKQHFPAEVLDKLNALKIEHEQEAKNNVVIKEPEFYVDPDPNKNAEIIEDEGLNTNLFEEELLQEEMEENDVIQKPKRGRPANKKQ